MKQSHRAYHRARQAVLDAQAALPGQFVQTDPDEELPPEVVALKEAQRNLSAAEEHVAAELDAAWERNRQAVADAKDLIREALQEQARVETACGTAARQRDPLRPVLNVPEIEAIEQARAAVAAARVVHDEAIARFKDGVTAEQLAGG